MFPRHVGVVRSGLGIARDQNPAHAGGISCRFLIPRPVWVGFMSPNQLAHREYLKSATWADLRQQVIQRDKGICRTCKHPGADVHHKTYKRWGCENLSDLITLCRPCHDAWHSTHPSNRKGKSSIGSMKLYRTLSARQRTKLAEKFGMDEAGLYCAMCISEIQDVLNTARKLLGYDFCYSQIKKKKTSQGTFYRNKSQHY